MKITCWGSRGSIPVSGKKYIKYGGDTTCIEIRTKSNDIIIIDAGTGIRRLGNRLISRNAYEYNFIFTHAHWDHLMGFPFFKPIFLEKTKIRVYRCPFKNQYVEKMISRVMTPPHFPIKYSDLRAEITYKDACPDNFSIGSVNISPVRTSHPNGGSGYKFVEDGKSFVFLTDNELGFMHHGGLLMKDYIEFTADTDLLIHDAEFTPEEYKQTIEWGHSQYADVIELATKAGVKRLGLFHLNQERSDKAMDDIVSICQNMISEKNMSIECFAVGRDMSFTI